jgi:hypothetical protein
MYGDPSQVDLQVKSKKTKKVKKIHNPHQTPPTRDYRMLHAECLEEARPGPVATRTTTEVAGSVYWPLSHRDRSENSGVGHYYIT